MNTDWIVLATSISIIVGLLAIIKFLFDLNTKITNLEIENEKQHAELKIENIKLQARFDKYDGVHTDIETRIAKTETQVAELKTQTAERINQLEADNKKFIKELFQSVENLLKRPPVL